MVHGLSNRRQSSTHFVYSHHLIIHVDTYRIHRYPTCFIEPRHPLLPCSLSLTHSPAFENTGMLYISLGVSSLSHTHHILIPPLKTRALLIINISRTRGKSPVSTLRRQYCPFVLLGFPYAGEQLLKLKHFSTTSTSGIVIYTPRNIYLLPRCFTYDTLKQTTHKTPFVLDNTSLLKISNKGIFA